MEHIQSEKNPLLNEVLADNSVEDFEKKIKRYSEAVARKNLILEYIIQQNLEAVHPRYLREQKALKECGSFLLWRHYLKLDVRKLRGGCTCKKHLLCSLCAIRRSAKYIALYKQKIKTVTQGLSCDFVFITWTVKSGFDLNERLDHMQKSLKRLFQKRTDALKKNPKTDTLLKHVFGAVYTHEVTYGETFGYHPHVHMIAMIPKGTFAIQETILPAKVFNGKTLKEKTIHRLPELWAGLVEDWKQITGDSFIVDVQMIQNDQDETKALVETFKYALKCSEMAPGMQLICYEALRGRKLVNSIGELRGVKEPQDLNDDLLPGELEYIDLLYVYSSSLLGFQLVNTSEVRIQEIDPKKPCSDEIKQLRLKQQLRKERENPPRKRCTKMVH